MPGARKTILVGTVPEHCKAEDSCCPGAARIAALYAVEKEILG